MKPTSMQVTFVRSHFTEIVSGEEKAGLPELPRDVIESLLSSEELETQSEDDILEVYDIQSPFSSTISVMSKAFKMIIRSAAYHANSKF